MDFEPVSPHGVACASHDAPDRDARAPRALRIGRYRMIAATEGLEPAAVDAAL